MSTVLDTGHPDPDSVPIRDAATLMLLRDGDRGLEVCMLQRNLRSDFVGGAYVFPGGGVDEHDAAPELAEVCVGRSDREASQLVGAPRGGLAYWVAAVRESFEEAGVLLARNADGEAVSFEDPEVARRFEAHRREVDSGRRRLADVCREEELQLDVGAMHYFSRWVTPLGAPRRYDTLFFVAAAPRGQIAAHDDREVVGTRWVTPAEALEDHGAGRITLIFPTVRTLVALDRFDRASDVLAHAAAQERVDAVVPMLRDEGDGLRIVLPGDPEGTGGSYDALTGEPIPG